MASYEATDGVDDGQVYEDREELRWQNPFLSNDDDDDVYATGAGIIRIATKEDNPSLEPDLPQPGDLNIDGEYHKSILLTPVDRDFHRELPKPGDWEDTQGALLCLSNDGITGVGDPGGDCKTCVLRLWDKQKKTRPCKEVLTYKFTAENGEDVVISLRNKTYANAGIRLNRLVKKHGLGEFQVRAFAVKDKSSDGVYDYHRFDVALHKEE